ncbi:MAG: hypothetical protein ACMUIM_06675 [bacterium]
MAINIKEKSFVSDSSSLILLAKAGLLCLLCENARLFITQTIEAEIRFDSIDSRLIKGLITEGTIMVKKIKENDLPVSLHKGERSAIILFKMLNADYLLIDDKKAALYCKRNAIPYVNALLIPHYLRMCRIIDAQMMKRKILLLSEIGHYAAWITEYVSEDQHAFDIFQNLSTNKLPS